MRVRRVFGLAAILHGSSILPQVAADPTPGCTEGFPKPVDWDVKPSQMRIFRVNARNVRVTTPKNYQKNVSAPLIVAFHDKDQAPERLEYDTAFNEDDVNPDAIMDRWISDLSPPPKNPRPKMANETGDLQFVNDMLRDLENLLCIDSSHIYATGLGTGAGMVHMLACDPELSNKFAAFAAVGGAFGISKDPKSPWNKCKPGRKPLPIAEIHGMDDRIFSYYLKESENGKVRQIPPHWVEEWSERNGCGEADGEPVQMEDDSFVTKLDIGVIGESITHSGGATRIARRCRTQKQRTDDPKDTKLRPPTLAETDVLHIKVKGYGHGWPRLQLRKESSVILYDKEIETKGSLYFDTSKILLEWFKPHYLPQKYAKRAQYFEMPGQTPEGKDGEIPKAQFEPVQEEISDEKEFLTDEQTQELLRVIREEGKKSGMPKQQVKELTDKLEKDAKTGLAKAHLDKLRALLPESSSLHKSTRTTKQDNKKEAIGERSRSRPTKKHTRGVLRIALRTPEAGLPSAAKSWLT